MQSSVYPKPPQRVPALIYTTANGDEGVCPVHKLFDRDEMIASYRNSPGIVRIEDALVDEPGWRNPNAMDLGTGNSAFERRGYLSIGNVIADTMLGFYVRPRSQTSCNGLTFPEGKLQSTDLGYFDASDDRFRAMTRFIANEPRFAQQKCIAYAIFHRNRDKRVVHGALVTETNGRLIRLFNREDLGLPYTASSAAVMAKARHYLTDERISDRKTIWTLH